MTGGVYDSPEDYFHTVQNLWNAMTFGEGNAALSPKCKWRSNDGKECGMVSSTNVLFGDDPPVQISSSHVPSWLQLFIGNKLA